MASSSGTSPNSVPNPFESRSWRMPPDMLFVDGRWASFRHLKRPPNFISPADTLYHPIGSPFQITDTWMKCIDHYKLRRLFVKDARTIIRLRDVESVCAQRISEQWGWSENASSAHLQEALEIWAYRHDAGALCVVFKGTREATLVFEDLHTLYKELKITNSKKTPYDFGSMDILVNDAFEFVWAMKNALLSREFTPGEFWEVANNEDLYDSAVFRLKDLGLLRAARGKRENYDCFPRKAYRNYTKLLNHFPAGGKRPITVDNVARAATYVFSDNGKDFRTHMKDHPQISGVAWWLVFISDYCREYEPLDAEKPYRYERHMRQPYDLGTQWFNGIPSSAAARSQVFARWAEWRFTISQQMRSDTGEFTLSDFRSLRTLGYLSKRRKLHILDTPKPTIVEALALRYNFDAARKSTVHATLMPRNFLSAASVLWPASGEGTLTLEGLKWLSLVDYSKLPQLDDSVHSELFSSLYEQLPNTLVWALASWMMFLVRKNYIAGADRVAEELRRIIKTGQT